ncbi:trypsin-like serine protease [Streptomyces sp. NPDC006864]|uniref:trypsin-like serine protease n=1 Tax=Streptomyces sp. NPDC006864 TaxID=3154780 RepID=UPI003456D513
MRHSRPTRLAALTAALIVSPLTLSVAPATAVTGPASDAADTTHAYTAQLTVGEHDRGCSGVLVAPMWIATSAVCFGDAPNGVSAGKPDQATTATIGRTDLTTAEGAVRDVVELVPRADRDLVLARLARPVNDIAPVRLAEAPPASGDTLTVAGYGRTKDEWAPLRLHTGAFTVDAAPVGVDLNISGKDGAAVCAGDAGGPALRTVNGTPELVAVNSRSWQGGCFGVNATRTDAVNTRTDDIADWIRDTVNRPSTTDFNGDGADDVGMLYDYGTAEDGRRRTGLWRITSTGDGFAAPVKNWDSLSDLGSSWTWDSSKPVHGDFNGDGKDDIAVLYNNGKQADGRYRTGLWTFTSTGDDFTNPVRTWDSTADFGSWNWDSSKPVAGDFNGDGKDDIAVLYNNGKQADGRYKTALWTFTSTDDGFAAPVKNWDSLSDLGSSWTWDSSKPVHGDFNGDGKDDIAVLYNNGKQADGRYRTGLWTFTSTGDDFTNPVRTWDSTADFGSWNWDSSKPVAGDFNGDGKDDISVLYDNGKQADGRYKTALWTFTSAGNGLGKPVKKWDSFTDSGSSWTWSRINAV